MAEARRHLAVAACLLAVACGPLPVSLSDGPQSFGSKDYERVFDHWTREKQVFNLDTMENPLTVSATFRSWQFRQAFVERYADDYRLDADSRAALLEEQRRDWEAWNEFLVASTATNQKWADFSREDSAWVMALTNDLGQEVALASLEKVSKPSPMLRTYYPFITVYRKTFVLRFPRVLEDGAMPVLSSGIGSFSLVFSGALGRAELEWKVKK
ncbi:MAG: hypothetical protein JRG91_00045 [Deltaproteobacteria bacterium]|nr:hypothetical protein [Deltaproteobacteria bacterium]